MVVQKKLNALQYPGYVLRRNEKFKYCLLNLVEPFIYFGVLSNPRSMAAPPSRFVTLDGDNIQVCLNELEVDGL